MLSGKNAARRLRLQVTHRCCRRWLFCATAAFLLSQAPPSAWAGSSLRFYGNGVAMIDRVKIAVDDPTNSQPGPPADVGATDFTIEFWMKALAAQNQAQPQFCGDNINWIYGNIIVNRDRYNQDRKFGLSIAGGRAIFGVSGDGTGDRTLCGGTNLLDGAWHHVAVQRWRSDGMIWIYTDGALEDSTDGPDGDISYPDDGVPGDFCGGPCVESDPFLVLGAEKHDAGSAYPSYSGWMDELRLSNVLRYSGSYPRPTQAFSADGSTVALYHFDEGSGNAVNDSSGAPGGPSDGTRHFGGSPPGPEWSTEEPFIPPTGVAVDGGDSPGSGILAWPNPFVEAISFLLPNLPGQALPARLTIHDVSGRRVVDLASVSSNKSVVFSWDRRLLNGSPAPAGLYIARLSAGGAILSRKLTAR